MKAILEMPVPESCGECRLRGYNEDLDYEDKGGYGGAVCFAEKSHCMEVSVLVETRHPACPLKVVIVTDEIEVSRKRNKN